MVIDNPGWGAGKSLNFFYGVLAVLTLILLIGYNMGWMGVGSFEALLKTTDPTYIDNFFCRSHINPPFTGCSMRWTGGMPCEAWMKTADLTYRKMTFLVVLTLILHMHGLQYGMDGWDAVQTLDENS